MTGDPTLTFEPASDTIDRGATGSWIDDGFVAGQVIQVSGTVFNDGLYTIVTVTQQVLSLGDDLVTPEVASGVTISALTGTIFGPEQVISTSADAAHCVFAADVDGDLDLDALSASQSDDKIAWYENTAGDGLTWIAHTISTAADLARWVFAADVDEDGAMDVLSASRLDDTIALYMQGTLEGDDDGDGLAECIGQDDCDDAQATVSPGGLQICNDGLNNDCLDAVWPTVFDEIDDDADTFTECAGDCDDADLDIYPGATQLCGDGKNNDCLDAVWPVVFDEIDDDGDAMTECAGDCDDADLFVYLNAPDVCDGKDTDCDLLVDGPDADTDGIADACEDWTEACWTKTSTCSGTRAAVYCSTGPHSSWAVPQ
jgi:hypothetical protein